MNQQIFSAQIKTEQVPLDNFTEEQLMQVDAVLQKHRNKPGTLIPALEEVQKILGYLPGSIQKRIAQGLCVPLSQVYGVVTFYSYFTMQPKGDHQIRVCLGTACHVRGSGRILSELERELDLEPGCCTVDRKFSLDTVRCLGACGLAPVMLVDEDTHRQVKAVKVGRILERYREDVSGEKEE